MKRTIAITLLNIFLISSCNNPKQENKEGSGTQTKTTATPAVSDTQETPPAKQDNAADFDINTIPISTVDIGDFPFFTAPEGSQYINRAKPVDFDFMVFVTPNDIYEVEGKTFRTHVHKDRKSEKEISGRYLIKSFEDAIAQAGGVKVFEGKLSKENLDKYEELCTYGGSNGSFDVWNNPIATYVIRRDDGNIYIGLDKGRGNTTSIQIVQEKPFEQTIKKITSNEISDDLLDKGKSILHINFDIDKATLTKDGELVVEEIAKSLKQHPEMKIEIQGHTDNTGDVSHNKTLSSDRAKTVLQQLVKLGIDRNRLTAAGFGAEHPIADNATTEGKAKNRRVELIKK